jgi:hypothetical protein
VEQIDKRKAALAKYKKINFRLALALICAEAIRILFNFQMFG